jgi:diguanylate cyclase (GGDEF)-like protein
MGVVPSARTRGFRRLVLVVATSCLAVIAVLVPAAPDSRAQGQPPPVPAAVNTVVETVSSAPTAVADAVASATPAAAVTPEPTAAGEVLGAHYESGRTGGGEPGSPRPWRTPVAPEAARPAVPGSRVHAKAPQRGRLGTTATSRRRSSTDAARPHHDAPAAQPGSRGAWSVVFTAMPEWARGVLVVLSLLLLLAVGALLRSRRRLAGALARAHHDVVTGLPNRAAAEEALGRMSAQARRSGSSLGVAMVDIDHFKAINDAHGHAKGDEVLASVGAAIRSSLRAGDFVGRWGGEEFLILLPDTDPFGAFRAAESVRYSLEGCASPDGSRITASLGVSAGRGAEAFATALVDAADAALYLAKRNGRNRTERALEPALV